MLSIKQLIETRNKAIYMAFSEPKPLKKSQKWLAEHYGLSTSRVKAIVIEQRKLKG